MDLMRMLIGIPLLIVVMIFAFVNNDLATFSLWPFSIEITISLSVAIVFFILFGFVFGSLFAWMSYAPVRKALRQHKRQCKLLTKEQLKLIKQMEGLNEELTTSKPVEVKITTPSWSERFRASFVKKNKDKAPLPSQEIDDTSF